MPLSEDVESFFEREVRNRTFPMPGSTLRAGIPRTGRSASVGYEINFNRYFYEYRAPRPLEEIEADIQQVEKEIAARFQGRWPNDALEMSDRICR